MDYAHMGISGNPGAAEGLRIALARGRQLATTALSRVSVSPSRAAGSKPALAAKPSAHQAPQADTAKAVGAAIANERARIANVFAAPAAHGRERVCATLLADPRGWSSMAIIAELPNLPKDSELASRTGAKVNAKAVAVWDRAIAQAAGKRGA